MVSAPIILVGGIRSLEAIDDVLESGWADFISMCRPFIREPNLPNEWKSGRTEKAACISCNKCSKYPDMPINCEVVNPSN